MAELSQDNTIDLRRWAIEQAHTYTDTDLLPSQVIDRARAFEHYVLEG